MMTTTTDASATEPDESLLEALAESLGRRLVSHSRVSSTVSGDGLVVAHQVELTAEGASDTSEAGTEQHLIYVETRPRAGEREGVLTFVDEETGDEVGVWVYPRDPALPALEASVFPEAAAVLLRRLGVPDVDQVRLKLEAYRPGKRAVIRVDADRQTVFLKVVAPGAAEVFAKRHNDWLEAGLPVPHVLGWSDDGLLALSALGGVPAPDAITRLPREHFIAALVELQDAIARVPSTNDARVSLSARLDWYRRRLSRAAPDHADRIRTVSERIEQVLAAAPAGPTVTIHGDLHLGQLFLDPQTDAINGVLDIDTAGLGDPADDAGALYAHLVVTRVVNAAQPAVVAACDNLAAGWAESWRDPAFASRAAAIAATHLLAHALNRVPDTPELMTAAERLLTNIRGL